MIRTKLIFPRIAAALAVLMLALSASLNSPRHSQSPAVLTLRTTGSKSRIIPDQHLLRAGADVTFVPLDATRSVVFELNGSLKVESIEKTEKALIRGSCRTRSASARSARACESIWAR
jgi:hypothetical protein